MLFRSVGAATWAQTTGGDVSGPASATTNAIAAFTDTTGKLIKNTAITIDGSDNMTLPESATLQVDNINSTSGTLTITGDVDATVAISNALKSATTTVNTSSASAPTSGQVLTATGDSSAIWQTPISAVTSVFTRVGDVVAESNDYTWGQIDKAISDIADITTKSHTSLTDIGTYTHPDIDDHIDDLNNPHATTAAQTNAVALTGNESISGIKSFTSYPLGPGTFPTTNSQLVDKLYADGLILGQSARASVVAATTAALAACTYSNGTAGVGATLTGNSNGAIGTIDGVSVTTGDRILIKNQAFGLQNGIYSLTQIGDGGSPFILTRTTDYDIAAEITNGSYSPIVQGTVNANTIWIMVTTGTIVVGTTSIDFTQLSASTIYTASTGVKLTGLNFSADLSASGAISLTGNSLQIAVDDSSIERSSNTIRVKAAGITNTMLAGSIASSKLIGTDIATVGTITSGTWNGTAISAIKGGTGQTAFTTGDILYAASSTSVSKLPIGTSSQILTVSGGIPSWATPASSAGANTITYSKSLDTTSSAVTISNSAVETTIYTYAVTGNLLGTNKVIQSILQGTYLNNSGSNKTITARIKYGATTVATAVSANIATSATVGTFQISVFLGAQNSASVQQGQITLVTESGTSVMSTVSDNGVSAIDSTSSQNLVVTLQLSAATATQTVTKRLAITNMLNASDSIGVPTTRTISATAPLSGGGDLSANRTITTSMNTNKLIGRGTAGTGVMEEITLGTNLALSGTTLGFSNQIAVTSPKIVTDISDTNGNEVMKITATASAVNEITIANAATGGNASITASGETNVGIVITGKGSRGISIGNALSTKVVTLADGATPALDASLGNIFYLSAGGDRTIAIPSNPTSGQKFIIRHYANGGARTLALNTGAGGFRFGSDITSLTATSSGKTDYVGVIWNEIDSFFDVVAYVKGY